MQRYIERVEPSKQQSVGVSVTYRIRQSSHSVSISITLYQARIAVNLFVYVVIFNTVKIITFFYNRNLEHVVHMHNGLLSQLNFIIHSNSESKGNETSRYFEQNSLH